MRFCLRLIAILAVCLPALGSELTIKVVDPASAVVADAQVEILTVQSNQLLALSRTSPQGTTRFRDLPSGNLRLHILAAGFAEQWQDVSAGTRTDEITISLQVAVAQETVVVTATGTPVANVESGVST